MADPKRALILHLAAGGEPVVFALSEEGTADLDNRLEQLLREGLVHAPALAEYMAGILDGAYGPEPRFGPHERIPARGLRTSGQAG